jgi:F0F1-type ATP synthase beta subunit
MNNNSAAYLEKIEGMQSYENIIEMLGGGELGKEVKNIVAKVKRLKAENNRLRSVVCVAVNERFPKKAGLEFLQNHRITNQFGVMEVDA